MPRQSTQRWKIALCGQGRNDGACCGGQAGVTTGEWGGVLREVFDQYRGPTGVSLVLSADPETKEAEIKAEVERVSEMLGRTITYVLGKPGLDGHSNGAEQIATKARKVGMNVRYDGIRFTPEEIANRL